jgi:hypothetical protein
MRPVVAALKCQGRNNQKIKVKIHPPSPPPHLGNMLVHPVLPPPTLLHARTLHCVEGHALPVGHASRGAVHEDLVGHLAGGPVLLGRRAQRAGGGADLGARGGVCGLGGCGVGGWVGGWVGGPRGGSAKGRTLCVIKQCECGQRKRLRSVYGRCSPYPRIRINHKLAIDMHAYHNQAPSPPFFFPQPFPSHRDGDGDCILQVHELAHNALPRVCSQWRC